MYAIMETGGKQYRVEEGDVIFVEKIEAEANTALNFDKIVMVGDENGVKVCQRILSAYQRTSSGRLYQPEFSLLPVLPYTEKQEQSQPVQAVPQAEEPKALEETPAVEEPVQAPEEEAAEETAVPSQEEDAPSGEEETDEDKEV